MAPQVYTLKLFCVLSYISLVVNGIYKKGGEEGGRESKPSKMRWNFLFEREQKIFFSLEKDMICISSTKGGWVLSNKDLTVYPLTTEDGMNVPLVLILTSAKYFSLFFSFINQAKIPSTEVTKFGFQGLNGHFQMMHVLKTSSFLWHGKYKLYS